MPSATNSLTAVGPGTAFSPGGASLNAELRGTFLATVILERSFDGTNWVNLSIDLQGNGTTFTRPVTFSIAEFESAASYRWNVVSYTSGTVVTRLSN